jgi:glycerophosphoryl diester phosphodiesterase
MEQKTFGPFQSFQLFSLLLITLLFCAASAQAADRLIGRAVLDAKTFASGPTSGTLLGPGPINGVAVPFENKQPVQGFSGVLDNGDGSFDLLSDNGFGSLENSADYHLRVYTVRPDFKTESGGSGAMAVERFITLHDPDRKIPFAVTNHFTEERILTGADFDLESIQRGEDGTLWFGEEFGPFLLHTDATGKMLEPPIPLPDFEQPGREVRAPQNPFNEEGSTLRIMNALRAHARQHGNLKTPVFSPWHVMLDDGDPTTFVENRLNPPAGSGLPPASSEIFSVASIQRAGYPVVVWTVNDKPRMTELIRLGVNGIISDRPDLLREAVEEFDANNDGTPGDLLDADGLIDINRFDAQGHRGGRNLRPENTLPSAEVALDFLMTTIEGDTGVTSDGVPVLYHDHFVESAKCRRADGLPYEEADEVLVKNLTVSQIQETFICDRLLPGRPDQTNDTSLSPVSVAFAAARGLDDLYVLPSLPQLFDFVSFYVDYYQSGVGSGHPDATRRWKNAAKVRFNIETKINPHAEFAPRTIGPEPFVAAVAGVIVANGLEARVDLQSFDLRTLLVSHRDFPQIRTIALFGDFPLYADRTIPGSDDGTNLQPDESGNTPWLAGLFWPYRVTWLDRPFRAQTSGGFEGMVMSPDKKRLFPLLEKPLVGGIARTLLIHEFDIEARRYTGTQYLYRLHPRGEAIGDFILFSDTKGLVIERDNSQGDLGGFKAIYEIELNRPGRPVGKRLSVDLLNILDPHRISEPGLPGDVGIGDAFAFPFVTIEDVVIFDQKTIGVLNDNNFPFSIGRHVGAGRPDDTEFILIELDRPLK